MGRGKFWTRFSGGHVICQHWSNLPNSSHTDQNLLPKLLMLPQGLGHHTPCWKVMPHQSSSDRAILSLCPHHLLKISFQEQVQTKFGTLQLSWKRWTWSRQPWVKPPEEKWMEFRNLLFIIRLNSSCKQCQTRHSVVVLDFLYPLHLIRIQQLTSGNVRAEICVTEIADSKHNLSSSNRNVLGLTSSLLSRGLSLSSSPTVETYWDETCISRPSNTPTHKWYPCTYQSIVSFLSLHAIQIPIKIQLLSLSGYRLRIS